MKKPATIFDHLANITWKKTDWNTLDEASQKTFSPYLINRWLSMNPNYIEIVDMFQQYTIGPLSKKHVYQLYLDFLPKQKSFNKYIKGFWHAWVHPMVTINNAFIHLGTANHII